MTNSIKVLSVNCQGLQGMQKRHDVLTYLENLGAGIFCLQDTHWLDSDMPLIKQIWKGDCLLNGKKTNSRGVAILFTGNFEYKIVSTFADDNGNLIEANISLSDCTLKLINVYAPNKDTPIFFDKISDLIANSQEDHVIICGDLNLALDPSLDVNNYKAINNPHC